MSADQASAIITDPLASVSIQQSGFSTLVNPTFSAGDNVTLTFGSNFNLGGLTFKHAGLRFPRNYNPGDMLSGHVIWSFQTISSAGLIPGTYDLAIVEWRDFVPAWEENITIIIGGPLVGDVDMNGAINFLDISPFISLLATGQYQFEGDMNGDGEINFLDIFIFVEKLQ